MNVTSLQRPWDPGHRDIKLLGQGHGASLLESDGLGYSLVWPQNDELRTCLQWHFLMAMAVHRD